MSASETTNLLNDLDLAEGIRRTELGTVLAEERIDRLLRTAFKEGDGAVARFHRLIRIEGPEEAIKIAEGRGTLPRRMWLGAMRGNLLRPAERQAAKDAISELREAMREYRTILNSRDDLRATRQRVMEERLRTRSKDRTGESERPIERQPDTGRKR